MLRRRRYRPISPGSVFSFLLFVLTLLLLVEGLLAVDRKIRPSIFAAAVMICDGIATRAINKVILEEVVPTVNYKDLVVTEKDDVGKIVMAQTNIAEINRIMALTTVATGNVVTEISKSDIKIPLGQATNIFFLAGRGPEIPVRIKPMGRVNTVVFDSFEEAGINQTRHKIYLQVITEVQIIIPLIKDSIEVFTVMPLADTIYIGEVPETLINLSFPRAAQGYREIGN